MYHQAVNDVTAFVLAGGKSTRMGSDKAFLGWGKQTLLAHSLALARTLSPEALIVGPSAKFASYGAVVEDVLRDRGPLGGIHAALLASATDLNLILAVDLPLIEPKVLKYLVAEARRSTAIVTVPRVAGGWQPLCAVYRREFARIAERALREGNNKIDSLFTLVEIHAVEEQDLSRLGFSSRMFQNVNTPKDLEKASKAHS